MSISERPGDREEQPLTKRAKTSLYAWTSSSDILTGVIGVCFQSTSHQACQAWAVCVMATRDRDACCGKDWIVRLRDGERG